MNEVVDLTDSDQESPTPERQDDGFHRKSTVEATGAGDSDLPTLKELFLTDGTTERSLIEGCRDSWKRNGDSAAVALDDTLCEAGSEASRSLDRGGSALPVS